MTDEMITLCAWCKRIRTKDGRWEDAGEEHSNTIFTHGICPDCLKEQDPQLYGEMLGNADEEK